MAEAAGVAMAEAAGVAMAEAAGVAMAEAAGVGVGTATSKEKTIGGRVTSEGSSGVKQGPFSAGSGNKEQSRNSGQLAP